MSMTEKMKGPQFIKYFGPVVDALRDLGGSGSPSEVIDAINKNLRVAEKVQNETTSNGQSRYANQIAWARFYLSKAGLLDSSKRGVWSLTDKGRNAHLDHDAAYAIFQNLSSKFRNERKQRQLETSEKEDAQVNEEDLEAHDYRAQLIQIIQSLSAKGFERLCQRLLRESGFKQVEVTGRSGDGGIDGIGILEVNPLVSFRVLFQCKKYEKGVSASQVRDFRGAMQGRADKGIILTTGTFTTDARKESLRDGVPPIELVDGEKLITMFEDLELGLKPVKAFEIQEDFFDDYREDERKEEK